jgi:hypothetical protein
MWLDKNCKAPLSGTLFYIPAEGEAVSVAIGFDLDQPRSVARVIDEIGAGDFELKGPYFTRRTISLGLGEQQTFQVQVSTLNYYCEYEIVLQLLANGKVTTQSIGMVGNLSK